MPVLPVRQFEQLWVQVSALLSKRPRFSPPHPLGCPRERIADRVVLGCTEQRQSVVDFYLFRTAALVDLRQLIHRARRRDRWPSRPTTRRLE